MKEHVYGFPLWMRSIKLGSAPYLREKLLSVDIGGDEVGLFVEYSEEDQFNPDIFKNCLRGKRATECLVTANHPAEAIRIFREEWEGAKVGGHREELKALRIRKDVPIIEFPFCDSLHVLRQGNDNERFICGEPKEEGAMLCAVEGRDTFNECPIQIFYQKLFGLKKEGKVPISMVQGYKIILAKNIMEQG